MVVLTVIKECIGCFSSQDSLQRVGGRNHD
jgi:hypothetical protein